MGASGAGWIRVCPGDRAPEGKLAGFVVGDLRIALFRRDGAVYAIEDRCPHRGARLSEGVVYEGCKVACPDHGWSIDLIGGAVEAPEQGRVRSFPVALREGWLWVQVDEGDGA